MAFTGITATEAEIDQKSGANVSSSFTDTMKTQSLLQAENYLNTATLYNWSDNWAALNVDVKYIITGVTASLVAIDAIEYDPDAIGRAAAVFKVNVLLDIVKRGIKLLGETAARTFIKGV